MQRPGSYKAFREVRVWHFEAECGDRSLESVEHSSHREGLDLQRMSPPSTLRMTAAPQYPEQPRSKSSQAVASCRTALLRLSASELVCSIQVWADRLCGNASHTFKLHYQPTYGMTQ